MQREAGALLQLEGRLPATGCNILRLTVRGPSTRSCRCGACAAAPVASERCKQNAAIYARSVLCVCQAPVDRMAYLVRVDEADELVAAPEAAQAVAVDVLLRPLPASGGHLRAVHARPYMWLRSGRTGAALKPSEELSSLWCNRSSPACTFASAEVGLPPDVLHQPRCDVVLHTRVAGVFRAAGGPCCWSAGIACKPRRLFYADGLHV